MIKLTKTRQESGPKTPAWIVSFTDMITLLLAFFVMLQAFARDQDPDLFLRGQGSFRRHIAGLGIPDLLFGKRHRLEGVERQVRHPTEEDEEEASRLRVIDPEDERIREIFQSIKSEIDTKTSEVRLEQRQVIPTPISFAPGSDSLSGHTRQYLADLGADLRETLDPKGVRIYVIGSAADAGDGMEAWMLSARRAEAVSAFLSTEISRETGERRWVIASLGTGSGRARRAAASGASGGDFIRIAIIESEQ